MGVDLHHVLPYLGFHRGRMGGLASEPVTGHRRLGLDGGNTEGSSERMSSRGVAGRVGGDERLRPVGLTAQHLLRDVAPQAEPDQDDLPGRHVVQQGQNVLDRGVEPEGTTRRPVPRRSGTTTWKRRDSASICGAHAW